MKELPKVLVFLGAGASVPFGNPTMQEMVTSFEKALAGGGITMPAEFSGTAAELYRSIRDTLLAANGYADLESVFSVIEMISKNVEYRELGYTPTFTLSRLAGKSPRDRIATGDEQKAASHLLEGFKKFVRQECAKADAQQDKIDKVYRDFFNTIGEHDRIGFQKVDGRDYAYGQWPIYTTNYDRVIENYWRGVLDINDLTVSAGGMRVIDTNRATESTSVKLVKVHGSLDWYRLKDGTIVNAEVIGGSYAKRVVEGEQMLYPIQQKDMYLEPWFGLFRGLKFDLNNYTTWIIIGYNFNDEFIHEIFKEALRRKKHKVILISPGASKTASTKFAGFDSYMRPLDGKFGSDEIVSDLRNELLSGDI